MYARLIYEAGATKLSFFFNSSGPKKALSLSLDVKCDQQTHIKKRCLQLWHQSQENYPTKSQNNSANMFFPGEFPHKIEAFFAGFEGVFMGLNYGKLKC
jgi:hypothetical protein